MRDAFNFILPVTREDTMQQFGADLKQFPRQNIHVSSNGYYGYQPVTVTESDQNRTCEMQVCAMDVQFNNMIADECRSNGNCDVRGHINRKRNWAYAYETNMPEFKKKRENENNLSTVKNSDYVNSQMDPPSTSSKDMELLEELLIETHGVSWYHWCGNE